FTVQRQKGAYGRGYSDDAYFDNFNDPNNSINRRDNYLNFDSTYVFKVDCTYELPWGLSTGVNFQHFTGYPIQPVAYLGARTLLNQDSEQIILQPDRKSTRLNSSHQIISYAVFCLKKKTQK